MSDTASAPANPTRRSGAVAIAWLAGAGIPLLAIITGSWLLANNFTAAGAEFLVRYIFGERDMEPLERGRDVANPADPRADLASDIHDVIARDWSVIGGYFLILFTCSLIFMLIMLAFSSSARNLSFAIFGAVIVTTVMDVAENILVLMSTKAPAFPSRWHDGFWTVVPAAVATVKWCALIIALCAVPAAIFAVWRLIVSYISRRARRKDGKEWWDRALSLPEEPPKPDQNDAENNWRRAYFVPGADDLVAVSDDTSGTVPTTPSALCLSGGGIRSGCVAMGAMQTLSRASESDEPCPWQSAPMLDGFDYVISVSGGGYTAGARLMALQKTDEGGVAEENGRTLTLADRFGPGSPEFGYLRSHSSYIADSPIGLIRALAEVFKNLVLSVLMLVLVAVIFGWIFGWFVARLPLAAFVPSRAVTPSDPVHLPALDHHLTVAATAVAIPVFCALALGGVALLCEYATTKRSVTVFKDQLNKAASAISLLAVVVFAVTFAVPALMWLCAPLTPTAENKLPSLAAFGGFAAVLILQYGATIISMVTKRKEESGEGRVSRIRKMLPPGVGQLLIVLLTLTVLVIAWLLVVGIAAAQVFGWVTHNEHTLTPVPHWFWILLAIAVVVTILSCIDVTSLSLHPFYRGRLARAFAVRRIGGEPQGYKPEEGTRLDRYGHSGPDGPKFVFAAAAALSGDAKPAPGLNAVSYVLSADYIGGPALGWLNTAETIEISSSRIQRDLTVQAAVAVSGAAFASAMGRMNKGFQSLLAVSGARLGTWLPNPVFVKNAKDNAAQPLYPKALPSVRGAGYFYRELFGINRKQARLVQVTDGGHYENLGLVEALRRRCRLIYVIDGGGDTPPLLSGLSDAIRLARFELGVEIELDESGPYGVPNLAPGSAEPFGTGHAFHSLNDRLTAGAVVRGVIKYPDAAGLGKDNIGLLIVAKAVLWHELPDWVLTYGAGKSGESFPNDKTSDQWFNEAQFAAYTEVGRRIAVTARTAPSHQELP
jgi:hypothetical protein